MFFEKELIVGWIGKKRESGKTWRRKGKKRIKIYLNLKCLKQIYI